MNPDSTAANDNHRPPGSVQINCVEGRFQPFAVAAMIRRQMDLLAGSEFKVASRGPSAAYAAWLLGTLGASVDHQTMLAEDGLGLFLGQGARYVNELDLSGNGNVTLVTDVAVTPANRAELERVAAGARVIWITPWGLGSDWAEQPDSDLALYAASGWMTSVGEPGREPIAPPGAQCRFIAGLFAAIAALEHHASGGTPEPGLVDVSVLESLVATLIYDSVGYQYYGLLRERAGERFSRNQPLLATLPCADGYMGLHSPLHNQWTTLASVLGSPGLVSDPRFATIPERAANVGQLDEQYILPWLRNRTRWEAYHELQANRIPSSGHPDMEEVLDSPQLRARKSWDRVEARDGRTVKVPGPLARVREESGPGIRAQSGGPWRQGALRVVDLSMGWAGPMVTLNLAAMGADVIKIESHTHFDWWRGSRPPGDEALGLHERSHVFNTANRGKRGITLDLASERGRDLAIELISTADVLIENYAAGVVEKLGLSYDVLIEKNPSLVMVRQPGFGADGPESGYVVFGNTIEGMSGLSSLTGYDDGRPMMLSNACGDPVSGLGGTVALLAAVAGQRRDGKGRLVECAQLEGFLPLVSEGLLEFQLTGQVPPRKTNRRAGHEPSGAYHAGDDRWVVIDVEDDAQWERLAGEIGEPWAVEPSLALAADREARRSQVAERLIAWVVAEGADAVLEACVRAGVPASLVHNEAEILGLEPLLVSDFWQGMEREPVGYHMHPTIAYSMSGERPLPQSPAPLLGQHTDEVLGAMGYDEAARAELAAAGVTGRTPVRV